MKTGVDRLPAIRSGRDHWYARCRRGSRSLSRRMYNTTPETSKIFIRIIYHAPHEDVKWINAFSRADDDARNSIYPVAILSPRTQWYLRDNQPCAVLLQHDSWITMEKKNELKLKQATSMCEHRFSCRFSPKHDLWLKLGKNKCINKLFASNK